LLDVCASTYSATEDISSHPIAQIATNPIGPLNIYDDRIYPGASRRILRYDTHAYNEQGRTIRQLNQTIGVQVSDHLTIIAFRKRCSGCSSNFTPDGYNEHIQDGRCTNHPDLVQGMLLERRRHIQCSTFSSRSMQQHDPAHLSRSHVSRRRVS
jgi:hypothetical protein